MWASGLVLFGCWDAALSMVCLLRGPHTDNYRATFVSRLSRRQRVDRRGTHSVMGRLMQTPGTMTLIIGGHGIFKVLLKP